MLRILKNLHRLFLKRSNDYVSVQAFLERYGIGEDAIEIYGVEQLVECNTARARY